ncbi:MAG: ABC transporter permease [Ruminococcus sp.]|jgi:ribose transport system permease protein|nr:ABC transporter permease [Ruminococcus sp.]
METKKKVNLSEITLYLGVIVIFLAITVACKVVGKDFFTLSNIFNIIAQASITSIIAIGASLVILTGGIELSVGSVVGFAGILGGILIKNGIPVAAACAAILLSGIVFGAFNGILVSYGKVPAFITTLGTMQIARGMALLINAGQPVSGFPQGLSMIMGTRVFGKIPISVFYVAIFYLVVIFMMSYTKFGRHVYSLGGNVNAARLSGVRVKRVEMMVYILCGAFAAIAGIMLLSRLTYADPNAGNGYEMNAIAATVIGGISLSGGRGRIGNSLVGAIILSTLTCGLQIMNVATYYQTIITGLVIIAAVFADKRKERRAE